MVKSKYFLFDFDCYFDKYNIFYDLLYKFVEHNRNGNLVVEVDNDGFYEVVITMIDHGPEGASFLKVDVENKNGRKIGSATFLIEAECKEYDFKGVFEEILNRVVKKKIDMQLDSMINDLEFISFLKNKFNVTIEDKFRKKLFKIREIIEKDLLILNGNK